MVKQKPFYRCLEIITNNGLKTVLATVSFFVVVCVLKYFLSFVVSDAASWITVCVSCGILAFYYNSMSQAKGNMDIKNALLLDWLELKIRVHFLIIFCSLCAVLVIKLLIYILNTLYPKNNNFYNVKSIAYARRTK